MDKKTVLVIFGGQSSEHEVSCRSAVTVINGIDLEKYDLLTVGITKEGNWLLYNGDTLKIKTGQWQRFGQSAVLTPDTGKRVLLKIVNDRVKSIPIDVVFPVLHGLNGEDGTIQGLLEMLDIPYVGCGVLASSIAMDKDFCKLVAKSRGIRQTPYLTFHKEDQEEWEEIFDEIEEKIGYPCFIKPANSGSSIGISKARNRSALKKAFYSAMDFDDKIIAEKAIIGMELECAVLGGRKPKVSILGQIIPSSDFYDYNAKYIDNMSQIIIPAPVSKKVMEQAKEIAIEIFKGINGYGMARVDFFWEEETQTLLFNEINTIPGFTSISMFPMLLEYEGMSHFELIDTLIDLAFERKSRLTIQA